MLLQLTNLVPQTQIEGASRIGAELEWKIFKHIPIFLDLKTSALCWHILRCISLFQDSLSFLPLTPFLRQGTGRKQTGICSRNQVKAALFWASRKALVNTMLAAIFKIGNEVKNGLKSYQPWLRLSHWNRMPWIPEETLLDRSHLSSNTDFPTLRKHTPQRPLEMEDDKLLKLMLTNYSV